MNVDFEGPILLISSKSLSAGAASLEVGHCDFMEGVIVGAVRLDDKMESSDSFMVSLRLNSKEKNDIYVFFPVENVSSFRYPEFCDFLQTDGTI